eukprot:2581815-Rhodomonas_salina.3
MTSASNAAVLGSRPGFVTAVARSQSQGHRAKNTNPWEAHPQNIGMMVCVSLLGPWRHGATSSLSLPRREAEVLSKSGSYLTLLSQRFDVHGRK